jgi:hypothetical protein
MLGWGAGVSFQNISALSQAVTCPVAGHVWELFVIWVVGLSKVAFGIWMRARCSLPQALHRKNMAINQSPSKIRSDAGS